MTYLRQKRQYGSMPSGKRITGRERGSSLMVSLLMLIVILLLGAAAARMALQGEKASRSDRDRQIAFQAAEAALKDAETDIQKSPDASKSRSDIFSERPLLERFITDCGTSTDADGKSLGLCKPGTTQKPVWLTVDFEDDGAGAKTVEYGTFTGQTLPYGSGMRPIKLPRYIIEVIPFRYQGESASAATMSYFYRITAVGFGAQSTTQVALQTYYRKADE